MKRFIVKELLVAATMVIMMATAVFADDEVSEVIRDDSGKVEGVIDAGESVEFEVIIDEPAEEPVAPPVEEPTEEPVEPEPTPVVVPEPIPAPTPSYEESQVQPEVYSEPVVIAEQPAVEIRYDFEPEIAPQPQVKLAKAAIEPEIPQTGDSGFSKILLVAFCGIALLAMKKKAR